MSDVHAAADAPKASRREVFAWAMYDWANSAFTTLSITMLVTYIQYVVLPAESPAARSMAAAASSIGLDVDPDDLGSACWAIGLAAAMLVAAILSPILGAMADARASKRRWLAGTAFTGAACAVLLSIVPHQSAGLVLTLFVLMTLCFDLSFGFYNGFLPEIADEQSMNRVSAWGFALGYIGGGVALALAIVVVQFGGALGLPDGDSLERDYNASSSAEFAVDLPDGEYDVTTTHGDAAGARDRMQITLGGDTAYEVSTAAGEFTSKERKVRVTGGRLVVGIEDLGGDDPDAVINGLTIKSRSGPLVVRFDFGNSGSPTQEDHIWVSHVDEYETRDLQAEKGFDPLKLVEDASDASDDARTSLRFGWTRGTVTSADAVTPARLRIGLLIMGLWWGLFTIPTIAILRDRARPTAERMPLGRAARRALSDVRRTLGHVRRYRVLVLFLLGFLFYNEGIQTVINQASVFATKELRFETGELTMLILMFQFICFPGAMAVAHLADRIGQKPALMICLAVWVGLVVAAYFVTEKWHFWCLSVALGLVMGGTQSISRAIMGMFTPKRHTAEFFGFFNFSGKATSWLGNGTFAATLLLTGSVRLAVVGLIVFFAIGWALAAKIDVAQGQREAVAAD